MDNQDNDMISNQVVEIQIFVAAGENDINVACAARVVK